MAKIKLSDLFQKRGHSWDGTVRLADQNKLKERLQELTRDTQLPLFQLFYEQFDDFCGDVPVSYYYLNLFLTSLTAECSRLRIDIE